MNVAENFHTAEAWQKYWADKANREQSQSIGHPGWPRQVPTPPQSPKPHRTSCTVMVARVSNGFIVIDPDANGPPTDSDYKIAINLQEAAEHAKTYLLSQLA